MRYSLPFALERGLQMGLPIIAVAVATVPIWGMSWYFNSENWAAAIYNSWAEQRTDTWRSAMSVRSGPPRRRRIWRGPSRYARRESPATSRSW